MWYVIVRSDDIFFGGFLSFHSKLWTPSKLKAEKFRCNSEMRLRELEGLADSLGAELRVIEAPLVS